MKILLVNDDGIDAVGIKVLAEKLIEAHDVCVVAPDGERSGFSHSVTIFKKINYIKTAHFLKSFAISGTPADCVKLGVMHLYKKNSPPDLVLSGINSGPNLGGDINYSGTVAAAGEGTLLGIPSVAVSLSTWTRDEKNYLPCADFIFNNLDIIYAIAKEHAGQALFSVNYPVSAVSTAYKGVVFTKAGVNAYDDYFDEEADGFVQLKGAPVFNEKDDDSDVAWIQKGYVTITPVTLERTHHAILNEYKGKVKFK